MDSSKNASYLEHRGGMQCDLFCRLCMYFVEYVWVSEPIDYMYGSDVGYVNHKSWIIKNLIWTIRYPNVVSGNL